MKRIFLLILTTITVFSAQAQFSKADSLRGGYGPGRDWWDLKHYDLHVTFDETKHEIHGYNTISFVPDEGIELRRLVEREIQIDLQAPMLIDSIRLEKPEWITGAFLLNPVIPGKQLKHIGGAWFVSVPEEWLNIRQVKMTVYFHGKPREAVNPPWEGGSIWTMDLNGHPWISIACQGLGASIWFPCKDSQVDEPDSVRMHYTCNSKLVCVSNGHFLGREDLPHGLSTFTWEVLNPINNYCMIPYIGDYVNMHEHYAGEKGMLELDYWVIRGNEEKAEQQFKEVPRMLEAFEHWFGPYPFYEDGYKLVEAPHLGMEHQSAIAYGNGFQNGYKGKDLSGTGEGLKWDFIIVHESGHEWFGNNITSKDIADMWIHEAFTNYSETLFLDYWFGTEHGNAYCIGLRKNIMNDSPIIGLYGVQREGSGDMYYKGANMLHTIRQLVDNDTTFRMMLREMNAKFYHQTVTSQQIEQFMADYLKLDLKPVFDQYLRSSSPPTLQMTYGKKGVKYRWINCIDDFHMKVKIDHYGWVEPTTKWQKIKYAGNAYPSVNPNFYIRVKKSLPTNGGSGMSFVL